MGMDEAKWNIGMKVKDKEKLNTPLEDWQILSSISSMVFHSALIFVFEWQGTSWAATSSA